MSQPWRRFERWLFFLRLALLAQLLGGAVIIRAQRSPLTARQLEQQQAVQAQQLADRQSSIEARVSAIETLRIAERLALFDDMRDRQNKIELLEYGVVGTLAGNLLLSILQLQMSKPRQNFHR